MATKRSSTSKQLPSQPEAQRRSWQQALLLLTLVPLVIGILLIGTALADIPIWGPLPDQLILGSLYILASFAVSNAVQKRWMLAGGWALLSAASGLSLGQPGIWRLALVLALGSVGVVLLVLEFARRWRQRQANTKQQ